MIKGVFRQRGFHRARARPRGQMAIFIALIFQVLFVFFAMAINVALVVHDKINLQNAVDLAAYYAAQRQAQMLDIIAHHNYMIRQSWKLLAWRYRVLGASGVRQPFTHPIYTDSRVDAPFTFDPNSVDPAVCVTHAENWAGVDPNESLCKKPATQIPALPKVTVVAGFLGFNIAFAAFAERMRAQMEANCDKLGAYNWWYALAILQAFREDQRNRKQVILALANNLTGRANGDFIDLDGGSVLDGAYATFAKNLTYANSQAQVSFRLFNSLEGVPKDAWLPEVMISPTVRYVDPLAGASCDAQWAPSQYPPARAAARDFFRAPLPGGLGAADLEPWAMDSVLTDDDYRFSLGVEKNPWYMAYMGVQAETAPRQIFFPFGNAVRLKARAYAKPFGGRIGPWHGSRWTRGAAHSSGAETDPLAPRRAQAGGLMNSVGDARRLPNYSRFPGDSLGLRSQLALNALAGVAGLRVAYDSYQHIWKPITNGGYNDIVASDVFTPSNIPALPIRHLELAAISPDLFDVTYYSIEPNFGITILPRLRANRQRIGIPDTVVLRGDLGQTDMIQQSNAVSVKEQIELGAGISLPPPRHRAEAFYFMRGKENLLTAWTTGEQVFDYSFPADRFGQCQIPDDRYQLKYKVPGSCLARGGRSGYSVRLVSRDYLFSADHPIGGEQEAPGPLLNPPPRDQGW